MLSSSTWRNASSGICWNSWASAGKIIGPIGLALIVGSSNIVKPDVTIAAILPSFLYLAAWSALAGFAYAFIGFETKGRSIEDIDKGLTAGRQHGRISVQGAVGNRGS